MGLLLKSQMRYRKQSIVLNYSSNLTRFTYIESNLGEDDIILASNAPKSVKMIHDKFKKFKNNLPDLRFYDFKASDLLNTNDNHFTFDENHSEKNRY